MNKKHLKHIKGISFYTLKFCIGIVFIMPIIFCLFYSFKPEALITITPPTLLTPNPTLDHYKWVITNLPFFTYLKNSLLVCLISILSQVIIASLSAYAFAFFEFRGKKLIFSLIIATMMIPADIVIIINYALIQKWDLLDSYMGLAFPTLISGTAIFMMRQYYLTIPKSLKDASVIDGCGDMQFLFKIAMPLSVPTIASLSLYLFIVIYNMFLWPLLVTNTDKMRTVQIGISMIVFSERLEYGPLLAGSIACILPVVLVFIFGQDYIVRGMTAGSIKG